MQTNLYSEEKQLTLSLPGEKLGNGKDYSMIILYKCIFGGNGHIHYLCS